MDEDSSTEQKTCQVYSFEKRNVFRLLLNESRWVSVGEGGEVIPCRWAENRKGAETNSGESGARNLEAEIIRSRAESTGRCVKLKTVTEIRRSSARDTFIAESVSFIAESVYLVLNSLLDWEPVENVKQRCDVVTFTFFFQYKASSTVLYATKVLDRGSRPARKGRIAVVEAGQNE